MNQQNRSYIVPSASRIAIRLAVLLLFSLLFAAIVAINFCLTTHFRVDKKCAIIFLISFDEATQATIMAKAATTTTAMAINFIDVIKMEKDSFILLAFSNLPIDFD